MLHKGLGQGLRGGGRGEKNSETLMLGLAATRSSKQLHLLGCAHSSRLPFTPSQEGTQKPTWRC